MYRCRERRRTCVCENSSLEVGSTAWGEIAMAAAVIDPGYSTEAPASAERHYAPSEVAALWHLSVEMIRRMFRDEPGVVVLQGPIKKGKRPYKTIRIPQSVLTRVHVRLQR